MIYQLRRQNIEQILLNVSRSIDFISARSAIPVNARYSNGTINKATMLMILINGFTAGPAVSL